MGFEACHPATNFIYFSAVIFGMVAFDHPIFLVLSFACAFIYSVKRNGLKSIALNVVLMVAAVFFALYYSSYHHFGVTALGFNFVGNRLTLESLAYGLAVGVAASGVIIWLTCVWSVFTTDKVVYLFGKLSPRISLYFAVLIRLIPRIAKEGRRINSAQKGIGRGINQGNIFRRTVNLLRILSMLISWTIGALAISSSSMRCRGNTLRGRTAFSIYRFDNRDRAYVISLFACMAVTAMGYLLRQTEMVYNPRLIWTPVTGMSYVFYFAYAVFCLMPFGLEIYTEWRFERARSRHFNTN